MESEAIGAEANAAVHRGFAVLAVVGVGVTIGNTGGVVEVELGVDADLSARSSAEKLFEACFSLLIPF